MDSLPNGKMPVVKETAKLAIGELAVSALTVGVYLLIGGTIYKTDSGNEKPKWFAQSVRYFFDETDLKRINEIWLKVMLDKDSKITVYASCGSGAWVRCLDSLTGRHDNEF